MTLSEDDKSLTEKLRILFKEQGITLRAIVAAVGLAIVLAVTGDSGAGAAAANAGGSNGKDIVQQQLERLGKFLKYLASKVTHELLGQKH